MVNASFLKFNRKERKMHKKNLSFVIPEGSLLLSIQLFQASAKILSG
jgi:hypothetical protein